MCAVAICRIGTVYFISLKQSRAASYALMPVAAAPLDV